METTQMYSSTTDRRPTTDRRRGAVIAEAGLVFLVLLGFLLAAPAIHKIVDSDVRAREEAHRRVFTQAGSLGNPLDAVPPSDTGDSIADFALDQLVGVLAGLVDAGFGGSDPADIPNSAYSGGFEEYQDFPNPGTESQVEVAVQYSNGVGSFKGVLDIERRAYGIRSSWALRSYPTTYSATLGEQLIMRSFFEDAYRETVDGGVSGSLKLHTYPVE